MFSSASRRRFKETKIKRWSLRDLCALESDWYVTLRESSGKAETDTHSVGALFYRWRNKREAGITILFGFGLRNVYYPRHPLGPSGGVCSTRVFREHFKTPSRNRFSLLTRRTFPSPTEARIFTLVGCRLNRGLSISQKRN